MKKANLALQKLERNKFICGRDNLTLNDNFMMINLIPVIKN